MTPVAAAHSARGDLVPRGLIVAVTLASACAHPEFRTTAAESPSNSCRVPRVDSYIRSDVQLFLSRSEMHTVEWLDKKEEIRRALMAHESGSTRDNALAELASSDDACRVAALVSAFLHRWTDEAMIREVLSHYDGAASFFSRYYAFQVLLLLKPDDVHRLSGDIARILRNERDEPIRKLGLILVPALDESDALAIVSLYMTTGSPVLNREAWAVAHAVGGQFAAKVKARLNSVGAVVPVETVDMLESGEGR